MHIFLLDLIFIKQAEERVYESNRRTVFAIKLANFKEDIFFFANEIVMEILNTPQYTHS